MENSQSIPVYDQFESSFRNVAGTLAAEGISISQETRRNLDKISSGQSSYQQVLKELRSKYEKSG